MRARELGTVIGAGAPGAHDAIADVPGIRVGITAHRLAPGRLLEVLRAWNRPPAAT